MTCQCIRIGSRIVSQSLACPVHTFEENSDYEILKEKVAEAKRASVLIEINGTPMVAVPYWFMRI